MLNSKFRRFFYSITILLLVNFLPFTQSIASFQSYYTEKADFGIVRFEVKNFDDQVFFIFYHSDDIGVKFNVNNKTDVVVNFDTKISVKRVNPSVISKFCTNIEVGNNSVKFKISNDKYLKYNQINGEKLTALRLKSDPKQEDAQMQKAQLIDKQNKRKNPEKSSDRVNLLEKNINEQNKSQNANVRFSQKISAEHYAVDVFFPKMEDVSVGSFIKNGNLYVIFDKKIDLSFPKNKYLKFEEVKGDKKSTIIRSKIKNLKYATVNKKDENWVLSISSGSKKNINNLSIEKSQDNIEVTLDKKEYGRLVYFSDPVIGEKILVIPIKKAYYGNTKSYKTPEFNLLPSIQGVVVDLYDKNILVEEHDYGVKISIGKKDLDKSEVSKIVDNESSILPLFIAEMNEISFTNLREKIMHEIVKSESELILYSNRVKLANFYFANQMYDESFEIYELIEKDMSAYMENDYKNRFVYAVLLSIKNKYSKADTHYSSILGSYVNKFDIPAEVELWANYNEYKFSQSAQVIGMDKKNIFLREYPDNLYWILSEAEIDNALQNHDFAMCELLFKHLRDLSDKKISNSYIYKKALFYNKKDQNNIAKKLLNEIVIPGQDHVDPMNYTRGEILKVKIERSENDITVGDAIKRLNDLRFAWRGDDLEIDLLINIAQYYKQKEDYVEALRTYVNMPNSRYATDGGDFFIASEVAEIYNEIFKPNGVAQNLDDFSVVSLFYEFRDYIPIGEQGDKIIISIVNRLINLELLDSAIDLLEHQVKYRLSGQNKIKEANLLSVVYIINNQPSQAIKILNETDKESGDYSNYQLRLRLKAKAMYDMGQKNKALEYISNDETEDGIFLRKELYFKNENWQQYIDVSETNIFKKISSNNLSQEDFEDVVKLSVCYAQTNDNSKLNMIKNKISKINLNNKNDSLVKDVENAINFLINPSLDLGYEPITKVLKTNNNQVFIDRCKKQIISS